MTVEVKPAPLIWVDGESEAKHDARRRLVRGELARVTVTYGPANGQAVVTARHDGVEDEAEELAIPLDEKGYGSIDWRTPAWRQVRFTAPGSADVVRPVATGSRGGSPRARQLGYRLRAAARFCDFVYADSATSAEIGPRQRLRLLRRIARMRRLTKLPFSLSEHLTLVASVLDQPLARTGDVVECGCWNGASTISLSLACALTGRRLFVCDSFEGLPPPVGDEAHVVRGDGSTVTHWIAGSFASDGGLEGVKARVREYGAIEACHFVKGYFEDTLPSLPTERIAFVYEDADLPSSVDSCLKYLWPRLLPGCRFYCDEPWSHAIVARFYDEGWWQRELGVSAPGFYGSEVGLPGAPSLGYTVKPLV